MLNPVAQSAPSPVAGDGPLGSPVSCAGEQVVDDPLVQPERLGFALANKPPHAREVEQDHRHYVPRRSSEGGLRQASDGQWQELRADGYWYPVGPLNPLGSAGSLQVTQSSAAAKDSTVPAGGWMAIIGGALMIIGAVLPWATATTAFGGNLSRNAFQLGNNAGFSIDGVVAVLMGVVTIVIGGVRLTNSRSPRFLQRSAIITGVVAILICADRYSGLNNLANSVRGSHSLVSASIGYGFWLLGVGGVVAITAGFILRSKSTMASSISPLTFAPMAVIPNATYRRGLTGVKKTSGNLCFSSQHAGIGRNSPSEAMVAWTDVEEVLLESTTVKISRTGRLQSTQDGCNLTFALKDGTDVEFQIAGFGGSEVQIFLQPLLAPRGISSYLDGLFDEEDGPTSAEQESGPSAPESLDVSEPDEDSEMLHDSDDDELWTTTPLPDRDEPLSSTENLAPTLADEIAKLGALHKDGILTDEEFASAKANLLNQ
jgi:hypothetical protein